MNKKTVLVLITIIVLIAAEFTAVSLLSTIQKTLTDNIINNYSESEILIAKESGKSLKLEISNLQYTLTYLATFPEIINGSQDSCNDKLTTVVQRSEGRINNLGRVDKNGIFKCSVNKALIGTDARNVGPYISDILNDPQHKPVLSRAISVPSVEGYAFALHVPVYDEAGNFDGTLGAAVYFNRINDSLLKDVAIAERGYLTLIDDDSTILYHPVRDYIGQNFFSENIQSRTQGYIPLNDAISNAQKGKISTLRYPLNNGERIAAFVPTEIFPDRIWVVTVTVPVTDVETSIENIDVEQSFNLIAIVIVVSILAAPLIILFYLLWSVFRPISKVTKSIKLITNGNLDVQVPSHSKNQKDEIDVLANAFNTMAVKLKESYHELENKVKLRTIELEQEKKSLEEKVRQRTQELENSKVDLERQVAERTKELQEKVKELESINETMVNREVKMTELKDEVTKLRNKIEGKET